MSPTSSSGVRVSARSDTAIVNRARMEAKRYEITSVSPLELFENLTSIVGAHVTSDIGSTLGHRVQAESRFNLETNTFHVTLAEPTYAALERGARSATFTLFHELGHVALHQRKLVELALLPEKLRALARTQPLRRAEDCEAQADTFAHAFMDIMRGRDPLREAQRRTRLRFRQALAMLRAELGVHLTGERGRTR